MTPPKPPLKWPAGIDPLISDDDLYTAIACRSEACIIGLARKLDSQGTTQTPYYFHGDVLQCLGLTTMVQHDIIRHIVGE
jgi:hypothetical protein